MVLSRGLVISLGVSALGCTLLFLYFRNKITEVERKVDVMFDLIQNHQSQQQHMVMQSIPETDNENTMRQEMQNTGAWAEEEPVVERNLIEVSEDEEDEDDDDSDEVSDSEEEDDEESPKLSLAKTEDMTLEINDVKKIIVQESNHVDNKQLNEPEDVTDSLDEIDVDEDDDDDEEEDEEEDDDEDHATNGDEEVVVAKLDEEFDYSRLKVSELKSLAAAKKLEGYKSLKKGPLIELLKSSE